MSTKPLVEWDVYVDGKWVGTVMEKSESLARCAALSEFDVDVSSDLSVSRR